MKAANTDFLPLIARFESLVPMSAQQLPPTGITGDQGYNRAPAIGDLNGGGWLDFAVRADNIGNTHRLGIPHQPNPSGRFENGHYQDISGTALVPGFSGEFACNRRMDRAGPDILFRDLDGEGYLDIIQSCHVDMNGAQANDLCASGEYWTGISVWKNTFAKTGHLGFEPVQDISLGP